MNVRRSLRPALLAVAASLFASFLGLRLDGGWYSASLAHRLQTEALLHGQFALASDPRGQPSDWAWGIGGVHQPWGLGLPLLRLPFEALARVAGVRGFPDRVVLLALLLVAASLVWRSLRGQRWSARVACTAVIAFAPPLLTLLRTRMLVYEETVAAATAWAAIELATLVMLARQPSRMRFVALAAVSGFGVFIRPTLAAEAVASTLLGAALLFRTAPPRLAARSALIGFAVLGALVALLCATNAARFGSPWEFGHRLNVSAWPKDQYAKIFDNPYARVPLRDASAELLSALFFASDRFNGGDFFGSALPAQADAPRFREFYFTTFRLDWALVLLAGWAAGWLCRRRRVVWVLASWSAMLFAIDWGFYVHSLTITSRYVVDFLPSFTAAGAALVLALHERFTTAADARFFAVSVVGWLGVHAARGHVDEQHQAHDTLRLSELARALPVPQTSPLTLPRAARCGDRLEANGIKHHGSGWRWAGDCGVDELVSVYLPASSCIRVETTGEVGALRVKSGLTELTRAPDDVTRFCGAPAGDPVQLVYLGFGASTSRLLRVEAAP